jgi:hypothetical protein
MATAQRWNQAVSYSRPFRRSQSETNPSAIISRPRPTITRKAQNTRGRFVGQVSRDIDLSPGTYPFQLCVR